MTVLQFLMTWSLFEAKCFDGRATFPGIDGFCERLAEQGGFDSVAIFDDSCYFHSRYQDGELYGHLMHKQESLRMESILKSEFASLPPEDVLFVVAVVVIRYRNNIFHGNKGVESWLAFRPQIAVY